MIQEVKTYYYANGISAFGFRCHFANSCRLFCYNFVEAKERIKAEQLRDENKRLRAIVESLEMP